MDKCCTGDPDVIVDLDFFRSSVKPPSFHFIVSIEAVAPKLPTFWTTCPLAWFAQTEAQFALRNLSSDDTRYFHVVAALDSQTATRALSVIASPPLTNKYEALKSFLCSTFGLSETERANTLLDLTGLGERKPIELMDSMLLS